MQNSLLLDRSLLFKNQSWQYKRDKEDSICLSIFLWISFCHSILCFYGDDHWCWLSFSFCALNSLSSATCQGSVNPFDSLPVDWRKRVVCQMEFESETESTREIKWCFWSESSFEFYFWKKRKTSGINVHFILDAECYLRLSFFSIYLSVFVCLLYLVSIPATDRFLTCVLMKIQQKS